MNKVNVFSIAVKTYLRDHKNSPDTVQDLLTPQFLANNGYLSDNVATAMLTPEDILVASVKKDTTSQQLKALIYNSCIKTSCAGLLNKKSKMIISNIGAGGGYKVNENSQVVLKGNFDSWYLKSTDWPDVNFTYPTIFKLVKYTPIPTGRFSADLANIQKMTYTVTSAGITSSPEVINNQDITWSPLLTNDKLVFNWESNGVSYVVLQVKDTADNSIKQTNIIRTTSLTIFPKASYLGNKYEITLTAYDENGIQGRQYVLPVSIKRFTSPIWKKFHLKLSLDPVNMDPYFVRLVSTCRKINSQSSSARTDTLMTLVSFSALLSSPASLPKDSFYLEPQKIKINLNGNNVLTLEVNAPADLEKQHFVGNLNDQYDTIPIIDGIRVTPAGSHFYNNVDPNCMLTDDTLPNYVTFTVTVDNQSNKISIDRKKIADYGVRDIQIINN